MLVNYETVVLALSVKHVQSGPALKGQTWDRIKLTFEDRLLLRTGSIFTNISNMNLRLTLDL